MRACDCTRILRDDLIFPFNRRIANHEQHTLFSFWNVVQFFHKTVVLFFFVFFNFFFPRYSAIQKKSFFFSNSSKDEGTHPRKKNPECACVCGLVLYVGE